MIILSMVLRVVVLDCSQVERVALKVFDDTEDQSRQKAIGVIKKVVLLTQPTPRTRTRTRTRTHDDINLHFWMLTDCDAGSDGHSSTALQVSRR